MTNRDNKEGGASVQMACPACEREFHLPGGGTARNAAGHSCCPGCGFAFVASLENFTGDQPLLECAICGCEEFYIQKDFNRQLGVIFAVGSLMCVFLLMVLVGHLAGLYCLFALAGIDFLIYWRWKNVTVCYLCTTIYRGFKQQPTHKGFYLGNEEKYKHLRRDWIDTVEGGGDAGLARNESEISGAGE